MEIKMVVVGYDGKISFPENRKKSQRKDLGESGIVDKKFTVN